MTWPYEISESAELTRLRASNAELLAALEAFMKNRWDAVALGFTFDRARAAIEKAKTQ